MHALAALQDRLYAQNRWAVLLIFQGMDAAGKDSAIKHVMAGVNPQGCQVVAFKAPSAELDHDYLWRCVTHLPERGHIGIFNRSYYEEVLVVRVHEDPPPSAAPPPPYPSRPTSGRSACGTSAASSVICTAMGCSSGKFFLHVSPQEQKKRFLERIDTPEKHWKFSAADVRERAYWPDYMAAYEAMIQHTAPAAAPWYVVPADHKWFTRLVVAAAVIEALASLDVRYPSLDDAKRQELAVARQALLEEP